MKYPIRLGAVCLARKTFDFEAAASIYETIRDHLSLLENVTLEFIPDLVIEIEDAQKAANTLAAQQVDGIICISGTFLLGHLILEVVKRVGKPILLWGLPELPYDGGKIRLNSVCGVNLNASNLYKSGIRDYHAIIGDEIDQDWVDAVRATTCLSNAHIGLGGYRAHGFFNLGVSDLDLYKQTGVLLDHYELSDIWLWEIPSEAVTNRKNQLIDTFDVSGISESQLHQVAELAAKLNGFMVHHQLDALALRCWPEFADDFGISPCAAMSLLQSEGKILACEGDVEGAVSMLVHQAIGAETPFLFDFSQVDLKQDFALLWHCGVAPCNLWDGKCSRSLDTYFAGGKGVTADMVLKSGNLSILRIDSAHAEYRVFLQEAEAISMDKQLKGTYCKAVFKDSVSTVLDKVINNGIAHHASMVYGDYIRPLKIMAKIKGWEVIR